MAVFEYCMKQYDNCISYTVYDGIFYKVYEYSMIIYKNKVTRARIKNRPAFEDELLHIVSG